MSDLNNNPKGLDELLKESRVKKQSPVTGGSAVLPSATTSTQTPTITPDEIAERFEKKMYDIRIKELEEETMKKATALGVPYIDLIDFPISEFALSSIDKMTAKENSAICFFNNEKEVRLATLNPTEKTKEILAKIIKETTNGGNGQIYLISKNSFEIGLKNYDRLPDIKDVKYGVEITGEQLNSLRPKVTNFGILNAFLNEEKSMTNIIAAIIAGAIEAGSSDIHIEAEESSIILRYRIDGVMQQVSKLSSETWHRLDSRIKNIAGLKINVTDRPQDGRITIYLEKNEKLELRVSTLPTAYGESIVMRLLKSNISSLAFESLGLRGKAYDDLKMAVEKPVGMIVTTGPTGSGKTTTLYAILSQLNDGQNKIITLEDPIEYKLPGVSQSQIDHSKGYSFADGLRSILRQDPNIVMVGELRDAETVETAIQAALTGHRVLSTIHTNDAAGAIPRFLSMGAKPYLLAPALSAVIGQRLIRKVHDKCKIEFSPDPKLIARAQEIIDSLPDNSGYQKVDLSKIKFHRGQGCEECKHIGYKGRVGIYEIFAMNKEFEAAILSGTASAFDMAEIAKRAGMITMAQDGVLKVIDGMTTLEEVFRVV